MSVRVAQVTDEQRDHVLSLNEDHFHDLKSIDIAPSKLTKSISGFANGDGGELFIGIEEDKSGQAQHQWRGFPNPEAANGHIQAFEGLFPVGDNYRCTFLAHPEESGLVLHVELTKSRSIIRSSNDKVYVRKGAQNLPVDTNEGMKRLERNKGITSFETETVSVSPTKISNSSVTLRLLLDAYPSSEPDVWLRNQELIVDDKPTVAGVVLFAEIPQAILPKRCGVKVYRYKTSIEEGTRDTLVGQPITIEGCAYDVIKSAVKTTQDIIDGLSMLGPTGLDKVSYPAETLHEVITNAVLHRDYSIADDVHIRIYDDRVEVESPGRLPAHITTKNILDERFARNGNIVRVINKFPDPPNKDVGEGLNTAFQAMRKLRLKDPVIVEGDHSVTVLIKHDRLASPEDAVMEYLQTHQRITNAIGRMICGIGDANQMKEVFYRLFRRGMIERVPGLKGNLAAWQRASPGSSGSFGIGSADDSDDDD